MPFMNQLENMENLVDSKVKFIAWHTWRSPVLIGVFSFAGGVAICLKGFIAKYAICDAPKKRPLNTLIMFDQATIAASLCQNDKLYLIVFMC